jgi:TonB family protein
MKRPVRAQLNAQLLMDRLQRRCVVASAGLHLLLVLIPFVGAAFFLPPPQPPGGHSSAPAQPHYVTFVQAPQAEHNAQQPAVPEAPPQVVPANRQPIDNRPANLNHGLSEARSQGNSPNVNTNLITRYPRTGGLRLSPTRGDLAKRFGEAVDGLFGRLSGGTSINLDFNGNHDAVSQNYAQVVREIYTQNWDTTQVGTDDETIAEAKVVIAADGRVRSAQVVTPSGVVPLDRSVRQTLDQVTFIQAFEAGCQEKERTYTIRFDLKAGKPAR